jgi:ABC-type antimicrobial peptide transport system permease subunit
MIPFNYSLRSLVRRPFTIVVTVIGLSLVVFVFAAVLMLARGVGETLAHNGQPDNVLILRDSAGSEVQGVLSRDQLRFLQSMPEIAAASDGKPLIAGEVVLIAAIPRLNDPSAANVVLRGISDNSLQIRTNIKVIQGRLPQPGTSELMVGKSTLGKYVGTQLGDKLNLARRDWNIVGVFSADGAAFESEIWGDAQQLMDAFNRPVYSDAVGRIKDRSAVAVLQAKVAADPQLSSEKVWREDVFFESQSAQTRRFIYLLGIFIAVIFAAAAAMGAAVTMYAQVAGRIREVGTLRAIGFRRRAVLTVFLREALLLSLLGGIIGTLGATVLSFVSFVTNNQQTFSEVTFHFGFGPEVAFASLVFSLVMGLLGGFTPAWRASRLSIVAATRGGQ